MKSIDQDNIKLKDKKSKNKAAAARENGFDALGKNAEKKSLNIDHSTEQEKDLERIRAYARRRASIHQETFEDLVDAICKQHPPFKSQAKNIATEAIAWAQKYRAGCEVIVDGIPKTLTDMKALDLRFAQLEAPGQPCVTINRSDAQPISDKDFSKRLSGETVLSGVDDKGVAKYTAASAFWNGNTHKKVYKKIAFTNQPVDESTYNLFTGFGIEPKQGTCDRILAHIKEVICASDDVNNAAFLNLLAWQIQNIGKPSRVIVILKSAEHQIGKGSLLQDILKPIYGNAGFQTPDLDQILGRFNDTLRGKSFIYLDEALFAGDKNSADKIKSLATATIHGVETKGVPTVQLPIGINFFLTTNHDDAAFIEETDLRYWLLEVSPHRQKDTVYFSALYAEIENGGLAAFMYYLLHMDVKGFVPARDVPMDNAAKKAMIRNSINPYDARKWLEECCRSQMLLGHRPVVELGYVSTIPWELWKKGNEYINGIFATAYSEWQKTVKSPVAPKPTAANKLGELLNKAFGSEPRVDGQRYRTLPDPEECLKIVMDLLEKSDKKTGK